MVKVHYLVSQFIAKLAMVKVIYEEETLIIRYPPLYLLM